MVSQSCVRSIPNLGTQVNGSQPTEDNWRLYLLRRLLVTEEILSQRNVASLQSAEMHVKVAAVDARRHRI